MELDKKLHFIVSAIIGGVATWYFKNPFAGIGVSAIVGVGKEYYDRLHPKTHTEDINDIYFDLLGSILSSIMVQFFTTTLKDIMT